MKKIILLIIAVSLPLIIIILSYFITRNINFTSREKVVCGTYEGALCYKYSCQKGNVQESIGGVPTCSDGGPVTNIGEIKQ